MNLCSFSPGNRVVLHSRVYTVASFNDEADRVTLVSEDDGSERQIEVGKAFLEYLQGNLKLEHARRVVPREKCTPRTRLHWINASRLNRAIAETRRRLVQFLDARGINLKDKDALKAAIADFEKEDEERREREAERADIAVRHLRLKASRPTIMRWKRGLRAHHGHAQGVLPATEYRGNGESRLSEDLESIVQLCLDNDYLVPGGTIAGAYDDLKVRINAHNARATADKQLRIPSLPTFRRRVHKIDPRESHAARYGGKAAAYLFRTSHRRPRLSDAQFMHVWQMDHATLDVLVKSDRTGLLLGRPRITAIIELVSRAIVGLTIGFQTTSTDTALECLRMAILPKDQEWLKSMGIQEHWPCHGVPLVLVLDNGAEFHSESFRSACALLGIDIEYCGTRMPWQKGAIERFIRTLNTQVVRLPGGTIPPHVFKELGLDRDPKKKPEKMAVLTESEITQYVYRWLVEQYHNKGTNATGGVPRITRRKRLATPDRLLLPTDQHEVDIACCKCEQRTITHTGIQLCDLRYFQSPELADVRARHMNDANFKVDIRYRSSKLDKLWFRDPDTGSWHAVYNADPESRELSEREIQLVHAEQRKADAEGDPLTFSGALQRMRGWLTEKMNSKMMKERRKSERILGIKREKPTRPRVAKAPQAPAEPVTSASSGSAAMPTPPGLDERTPPTTKPMSSLQSMLARFANVKPRELPRQ